MLKDHLLSRVTIPKHRLEALADGVFAIVVTLLVLEIKVPELERHASIDQLAHALRPQAPVFLSYAITFVISGAFWFLHQLSFHWIHRIDRALVFINIGFLMFVSLMPFSAGMFGRFMGNPLGQMFYYGNATAIGMFLNLHWVYARRAGLLSQEPEVAMEQRLFAQRILMLTLSFALAFALSPVAPQYSGLAAVLVMLAQRIRERRALVGATKETTT